ncbi:MAG: trypsin-like peptidase domain-containing protein, partial [Armatimonadetes bacterium]|nr:trypsin-like peptidase domain-containing protein [Armatimonadota bacterium]
KTRLLLGVVTTVAAIVAVALVLRFVPQRRSDPLAPMAAEVRRTVQAGTVWIRAAMAEGESEGSGFVSKSGYVFTNAHVVEGARSVRVVFDTGTPLVRSVAARLVRVGHPGEADDVALLAVPTGSVKPLRLTDAGKLTEGTPLAAFGFPLGSTVSTSEHGPQISIRSGTVTALRRDNAGRVSWVESDILAEVGNSGGPVVTHQGEVVGLATMLVGPNLRTARIVPANYLRRFGPQAVAP